MVEKPETTQPVFLFLQGPLSSFYSEIAAHLGDAGVRVHKVNICGNDDWDWHHKGAVSYRGMLLDWPSFLADFAEKNRVTHIVMHGDRRPYHKPVVDWARKSGRMVYVTELGYLRPDWMTIEPWGTSTLSDFSKDPDAIRALAEGAPVFDETRHYPDSVWSIVTQEARWTLFNLLKRWKYPHFETHRSQSPWLVYPGWISAKIRNVFKGQPTMPDIKGDNPCFVMALQLEGDFQLREHSPFESMVDGVEHVVSSFAAHAPPDAQLLLKPHPHEFNRRTLMRDIRKIASVHNVIERVVAVENVPIKDLCGVARGFITVNSSAGFEALDAGCPTHTLTPTIYDIEGLTFQGELDAFWHESTKPDATLFDALRRALTATTQVRGTLYDRRGRVAAAKAAARKLLEAIE